jgi:hypothetical protein
MNKRTHPTMPRVTPDGVSARFHDQRAASRATRSLQREHGLPTEAIGVSMEPGPDAATPGGQARPPLSIRVRALLHGLSPWFARSRPVDRDRVRRGSARPVGRRDGARPRRRDRPCISEPAQSLGEAAFH